MLMLNNLGCREVREQDIRVVVIGLQNPIDIQVFLSGQNAGNVSQQGTLHATLLAGDGDVIEVGVRAPPSLAVKTPRPQRVRFTADNHRQSLLTFELFIEQPTRTYEYSIIPRNHLGGHLRVNGKMVGEWQGVDVVKGLFSAGIGADVEFQICENGGAPRLPCDYLLRSYVAPLTWDLQKGLDSCPARGEGKSDEKTVRIVAGEVRDLGSLDLENMSENYDWEQLEARPTGNRLVVHGELSSLTRSSPLPIRKLKSRNLMIPIESRRNFSSLDEKHTKAQHVSVEQPRTRQRFSIDRGDLDASGQRVTEGRSKVERELRKRVLKKSPRKISSTISTSASTAAALPLMDWEQQVVAKEGGYQQKMELKSAGDAAREGLRPWESSPVKLSILCEPGGFNLWMDESLLIENCSGLAVVWVQPGIHKIWLKANGCLSLRKQSVDVPKNGLPAPVALKANCEDCLVLAKKRLEVGRLSARHHRCLREIRKYTRRWIEAQRLLSREFQHQNNLNTAAQMLERVLSTRRGRLSGDVYAQLAEVYYDLKKYDKAIDAYMSAWRYRLTLEGDKSRRMAVMLNLLHINAGAREKLYYKSRENGVGDADEYQAALGSYQRLLLAARQAKSRQVLNEAEQGLARLIRDGGS